LNQEFEAKNNEYNKLVSKFEDTTEKYNKVIQEHKQMVENNNFILDNQQKLNEDYDKSCKDLNDVQAKYKTYYDN